MTTTSSHLMQRYVKSDGPIDIGALTRRMRFFGGPEDGRWEYRERE